MNEDEGLKYLVLYAALEEISGQEPENIGYVFARCRYCGVSVPLKAKNALPHKEDCPAAIAFRALSKVKKPLDVEIKSE